MALHVLDNGICTECDGEDLLDEDSAALLHALNELDGPLGGQRAFDPAKHVRNPKGSPGGGRFRSMVDRLKDAITEHKAGGSGAHPFDGFDREQLRRVAKARGIELKRGEDRDSIAEKLLGHIGGHVPKKEAIAPKRAVGQAALDAAPIKMGKFGFERGVEGDLASELDHEALDEYRASGFQDINGMLREGDWQGNEHAWMVHSIDAAMEHSKLTHDVQVHRGVSNLDMFGPYGNSADLTGMEFRESSFASTTADPNVAHEFNRRRGNRGPRSAILTIKVPKGTGAVQLSNLGPAPEPGKIRPTWDEAELLLGRGLTYRITGDRTVDGVRQLEAEVVHEAETNPAKEAAADLGHRPGDPRLPSAGASAAGLGDEPLKFASRDFYDGLHVNGQPMKEEVYGALPKSALDERGVRAASVWVDGAAAEGWARSLRNPQLAGSFYDGMGTKHDVKDLTADMDHAVSQGVIQDDTELWRGIALTHEDALAKFKPGSVFSDPAYSATSFRKLYAEQMLKYRIQTGKAGLKPYMMRILTPAGTHAAPGADPVAEAVLGRNTRMKVHSVEPGVGREAGVITVEVLP